MPYVSRDGDGRITGVFAIAQAGYAEEFLEDGDAEMTALRNAEEAARQAQEAAQIQRLQDIEESLPSWAAVSGDIDAIADLADAKALIKKLARVVYWLAKNQAE